MSYKINTKCILSGYSPKNGEPRQVPVYQSTTYKYDSSVEMGKLFDLEASGYFYTRLANPTNDAVAAKIADLEGGVGAMLTSSGQAASFYSIFNIAGAGDHVVSASTIYGGTFNLFNVTMRKLGIDFTFVSPQATREELEAAFKPNTKAVFAESISNPSLEVLDFETFANAAHSHGVPLIVDNTFPTPVNCRPLELGADVCCDSAHKTLPVLTGGAYLHISKNAPEMFSRQAENALSLFASTSPSYLILQSLDKANAYLSDGYAERLAEFAKKNGFDCFTTTLSVSPHKNAEILNTFVPSFSSSFFTSICIPFFSTGDILSPVTKHTFFI